MATILAQNQTDLLVRCDPAELEKERNDQKLRLRNRMLQIKQEGWDAIASGPPDREVVIGCQLRDSFVPWPTSEFMLLGERVTIPASEWLRKTPRPT